MSWPGTQQPVFSWFTLEVQGQVSIPLDMQGKPGPHSPSSWQVDSGESGFKILSASQVAINESEGWDTELKELFGATQPAALTR